MSDTSFAAVANKSKLIDVMDDKWIEDSLSDDEIIIPKEHEVDVEQDDEDDDQVVEEDQWEDLGLDMFTIPESKQAE